jgi:hypothetical protein
MAFNDVGIFTLSGGNAISVWVSWGEEDHGAQWIMAHSRGPGTLKVSDFAKERRIKVPNRLETIYWATVTNLGGDTVFSLSGGGNV